MQADLRGPVFLPTKCAASSRSQPNFRLIQPRVEHRGRRSNISLHSFRPPPAPRQMSLIAPRERTPPPRSATLAALTGSGEGRKTALGLAPKVARGSDSGAGGSSSVFFSLHVDGNINPP